MKLKRIANVRANALGLGGAGRYRRVGGKGDLQPFWDFAESCSINEIFSPHGEIKSSGGTKLKTE